MKQHIISLRNPDALTSNVIHPSCIKQGTQQWLELRRQAVFTGSTLNKGLGLGKLKDQVAFLKEHISEGYDETEVASASRDDTDTEDQEAMNTEKRGNDIADVSESSKFLKWGRENEQHACATLAGYAIPLMYPGKTFMEVGASFIKCEQTGESLVEVSADGIICSVDWEMGTIGTVVAKN